jgi:hypothetical protein
MLGWVRRVWAQIAEPPRLPDIWGDTKPPFDPAVAPPPPAAARTTAPVPATDPPARPRSFWQEIADDPGAAALRARWEARWDEF